MRDPAMKVTWRKTQALGLAIQMHFLPYYAPQIGEADREDFVAYLSPLAGRVGKVRLIHGEREQAEALAGTLRGLGFADVAVPAPGDRVVLG